MNDIFAIILYTNTNNSKAINFNKILNVLNKNEKRILLILLFITIILRMVFVYSAVIKTGISREEDELYYINAAEQIAIGNWDIKYGNSSYLIVGPSLPIMGALFLKLFNNLIIPFFIFNIILTSLMVPVLYFLGKEVFNDKVGWCLALWGVFFYEAFKYCPSILKEPTLLLFVPLTLLFLVRSARNVSQVRNIILASLSFAWLIHIDERFLIYYPFFAMFFLLVRPFSWAKFLKSAGIWFFCGLLLMVPWGIRNYNTFNQVVILTPRTTAFTSGLWGDNLAETASHFSNEVAKQKLIARSHDRAIQFGIQHGISPREYGHMEARARAFINFWQPTYFKPTFIQYGFRPVIWSLAHNIAGLIFYGIFLPFYLIGLARLIKEKHYIGLFIAFIPIIHSLLHAYMVWPLERYRSPVSFIIVMVGLAVMSELFKLQKYSVLRSK